MHKKNSTNVSNYHKRKRCHKKELSRLILPAIIYDNVPYILASYNDEQVLIQSAGNKPPEIWQKQDFLQRWNGNWLKINQNNPTLIFVGSYLNS